MIDHGTVKSTVKPEAIRLNDVSVRIADDIREKTVTKRGRDGTEYEFRLLEYTKDEYIGRLIADNSESRRLMDLILGVKD